MKKAEKLVAEKEKLRKALDSTKEEHNLLSQQYQVRNYWKKENLCSFSW